ncbi:hypothetical protein M2277_004851 [Paenibacillus sp. LBL]|nr:hypothetical protein [Paenibacillus sp. LBL]
MCASRVDVVGRTSHVAPDAAFGRVGRAGPGCIGPQIRYFYFLLAIGGSIRHTIGSGRAVSDLRSAIIAFCSQLGIYRTHDRVGLYQTSDPLLLLFARNWGIYRTHDRIGPGCIGPQIRYYCFLLAIGGSIGHTIGSGRAVSNLRSVIIAFCSQLGDLSDTRSVKLRISRKMRG